MTLEAYSLLSGCRNKAHARVLRWAYHREMNRRAIQAMRAYLEQYP